MSERHRLQRQKNLVLLAMLIALVALLYGLTIVKMG